MEKIAVAENLRAYYFIRSGDKTTSVRAVDNVSLHFFENEVYGIAGESGCGKSTLLKVLFGEIKPPLKLVDGEVVFKLDGEEYRINSMSFDQLKKIRWKYVSYVPQGSMSVLNPVRKIRRIFLDVIEEHTSMSREEAFSRIEGYFEALGLPVRVLDSYPHQLSGGMRQRVTIALATVLNPKVIFADEPTTALDVVVQRGVIQLLKKIHKEQKNTLVIVTHDMGVHAHLATRIGVMYAGRLIEEAETYEIFKNPLHPYTRFLINSLPRFGDRSRKEGTPGSPPSLANLPPGCPFHPRCPIADQICTEMEPDLIEVARNHKVACWKVGVKR